MQCYILIYIFLSYFEKIVSNEKKEPNDSKNPMLEKSSEEQVIVLLFYSYLILSHKYLPLL